MVWYRSPVEVQQYERAGPGLPQIYNMQHHPVTIEYLIYL